MPWWSAMVITVNQTYHRCLGLTLGLGYSCTGEGSRCCQIMDLNCLSPHMHACVSAADMDFLSCLLRRHLLTRASALSSTRTRVAVVGSC
jgi:hypothetical protein